MLRVRHTHVLSLASEDEELDDDDDEDVDVELSASRMYLEKLLWSAILLKSACVHKVVIFMEEVTATPEELDG